MERRSARSEEPRFGLKWKAFFVLLALLASVHLVVGLLGYRSLVRASEQQQRERMQSSPRFWTSYWTNRPMR